MTKTVKTTVAISLLGAGALALWLLVKSAQAGPSQAFIKEVIKHYNPYLPNYVASEITVSVTKWTDDRNVNLFTTLAIIAQESHFEPLSTSESDAKGLMQLMEVALDELERRYGVQINRARLYEVDYNIRWGTLYYRLCTILASGVRFEAIARYFRTTDWQETEPTEYANAVLEKRATIVKIYEKYE